MSPFRFHAKYGLFTYAQCAGLDPFAVNDHFAGLRAECIIGREDHADGGVHLHAFAMWERTYDSRNVRVFDVAGFHPNIVAGKGTPEKAWDYATKDGDVVAGSLERPQCAARNDKAANKWADIILAESRDEFFERIASLDPRALCVSFGNLAKYADWKYRPDLAPYESPADVRYDTSRAGGLDIWTAANLGGLRPLVGK